MFPNCYAGAVQRFLACSESLSALKPTHFSYRHSQNASLSTHISLIRPPQSLKKLFLLTSGVHGVELFAGSAVQVQFLRQLQRADLGEHTGVAVVHAVNPFGAQYLRRTNGNNVDLARNCFADFSAGLRTYHSDRCIQRALSTYSRYHSFINPISPGFSLLNKLKTGYFILSEGQSTLRNAILIGQREFPRGLAFGGTEIQSEITLLCSFLNSLLFPPQNDIDSVVHIDIHTGFGPYSHTIALVDDSETEKLLSNSGASVLQSGFEANSFVPGPKVGAISNLQQFFRLKEGAKYYAVTVELGTHPEIDVFLSLRKENSLHWSASGRNDSDTTDFVHTFSPADPTWQSLIVHQGAEFSLSCLRSLVHLPS